MDAINKNSATIGRHPTPSTSTSGGETPVVENIDSKLRKNSTCTVTEQETASNTIDAGKPPIPNFRVEGSNAGDSSITVAAALAGSLSSSLIKSDNECGSLVDSSLGTETTETEEPGLTTTASTNGDLLSSLQSSEPDEMPLSLVSWYSEPGDCCTSGCSNSACCGGGSAGGSQAQQQQTNGDGGASELSDGLIKSDHSSVTPTTPHVDFLCDEKENKTPAATATTKSSTTAVTTNSRRTEQPKSHIPKKKSQDSSSARDARERQRQRQKSVSPAGASKSASTAAAGPAASAIESRSQPRRTRKDKMPAQVIDQAHHSPGNSLIENLDDTESRRHRKRERERVECPRCTRRSKSGSTPPAATAGNGGAPAKSASRRVHHHNKQSQHPLTNGGTPGAPALPHHKINGEAQPIDDTRKLKKPIKSILKSDSRSGGGSRGSVGSGSGSEKQSSMDSLGSNSGVVMTRSDSGPRTKFHITNSSNEHIAYPEDKMVSKLKRIEKYATYRAGRKGKTSGAEGVKENVNTARNPEDYIPDLMTKSMSFLEKSSTPFSHPHSHQSRLHPMNSSGPSSLSLRREGSLKTRKPSPGWEPCATRTSALRLLKMQENKAKTGGPPGGGSTGSAHSGSGESIQNQNNGAPSSLRHHHHHHHRHQHRSATAAAGQAPLPLPNHELKEYHHRGGHSSAKVFTKLSSALGQTASSSMKRLKQEKAVQTDSVSVIDSVTSPVPKSNSNSPEPFIYNALDTDVMIPGTVTTVDQQTEQIKALESLVRRYKASALRFQQEFERTDKTNLELKKQLQENQMESNEMLEFLQAEKSTLAESLVEVEAECKKLTRELESVVKESQSRCSSLVRLSEQHKQEALKAQTLLNRLEEHSTNKITAQATQLTEGTEGIRGIKRQILSLIETLMKTYKVSQDRLTMDGFTENNTSGPSKDETELRCTLLLPLIRSLSKAFDSFKIQLKNNEIHVEPNNTATTTTTIAKPHAQPTTTTSSTAIVPHSNSNGISSTTTTTTCEAAVGEMDPNTSLQKLNQAIIEREEAEKGVLDSATKLANTTCSKGTTTTLTIAPNDGPSLQEELEQLQIALRKLCTVIRIIVIHCDQKVSNVASDILQVLKSETTTAAAGKMDLNSSINSGSSMSTTTTQQNGSTIVT